MAQGLGSHAVNVRADEEPQAGLLPAPRVTLGLVTYRQESYVRHALRSVLAQTYAPLEVVVCDDASPDRTFELACEEANTYSGAHTVRLHRNESNLGIGNFNRLMELATGDFIVIAHGDDLSMPERVARLVAAWRRTGASMVTSNALILDAQGQTGGLTVPADFAPPNTIVDIAAGGWNPTLWGAVLAWHRDVFDVFGPLDPDRSAVTTDWILPFRAAALHGIHYLDQPLVQIRQHPDQKQQRYISNAGSPLADTESLSASHLIQFLYMFETMDIVKAKALQPVSIMSAVYGELLQSVFREGFSWRTARNRLFSSGVRARWLPVS